MELIEIATPWLLGITQSMLSDRDEAEEVIQEAFGIIWNRIHLLDSEQSGLIPGCSASPATGPSTDCAAENGAGLTSRTSCSRVLALFSPIIS